MRDAMFVAAADTLDWLDIHWFEVLALLFMARVWMALRTLTGFVRRFSAAGDKLVTVLREVSLMPQVFAAQQQLTGLGVRVLGAVVNGTDPAEVFTAPPTTASVA